MAKEKAKFYTGILKVSDKSYGFVDCENLEQGIFIPPKYIFNCLSDDEVKVKILENDDPKGPVGEIVQLLKRKKQTFIGRLIVKRNSFFLQPIQVKYPKILINNIENTKFLTKHQLNSNDWIEAKLIPSKSLNEKLKVNFVKKVGMSENLDNELKSIELEFGLQSYSKDDEIFSQEIQVYQGCERKQIDPNKEIILTIDPKDAKDFDDAISIASEDERQITIGIHIADVASYIAPNSPLMKKIIERCFTAYLPTKMFPMIPHSLVKACSLKEGEKKLAHSVYITYDKKSFEIVKTQRFHSEVSIAKRLNYDEVQQFIDSNFARNSYWTDSLQNTIKKLCQLAINIRNKRKEEELFLPFETEEFVPIIKNNQVTQIKVNKPNESKQLIEEFMLAANVAIAEEMKRKKIPCLYRIHDALKESKILEFSKFLSVFNFPKLDLIERKNIVLILEEINKSAFRELITIELLKTMSRAVYSEKCEIHFGLGKKTYCHFTSPIRRLSDLIVHQQLVYFNQKNEYPYSLKQLVEIKKQINSKEIENDEASRLANKRFILHYLSKKISKVSVTLAEIRGREIKVFINDYGLISFIPFSHLLDDHYVVSRCSTFIRGVRKNKHICLGDVFDCSLDKVNFSKNKLILKKRY